MAKFETSHSLQINGVATRDPNLKYAASGTAVVHFTIVTNSRKQIEGEWKDVKAWWNCSAFGKTAEKAAEKMQKGSLVSVVGAVELTEDGNPPTREYNGKMIPEYKVVCNSVVIAANAKEKVAEEKPSGSDDKPAEFDWSAGA